MVKYAVLSQKQAGFTLVELVTTIILISILAVVVLPRLFSTSSYSAYSLRHEFISELRQVQQRAMNNTDRCYRIAVSESHYQMSEFATRSGSVCSGSALNSWPLQSLEAGAALVLTSTNSRNFNIDFDSNGHLSLNCNGECVQVVADDMVAINVTPEGYIYAN